jgi:hypothetical protein
MTKWFTSLMRRIIGRIKENIVAILMGLMGIFLPSGVAFYILAFQEGTLKIGLIYAILGTIFWGIGIYIWTDLRKVYKQEEEEAEAKYITQLEVLDGIRTDIKFSIDELIKEIKIDRQKQNKETKKDGESDTL